MKEIFTVLGALSFKGCFSQNGKIYIDLKEINYLISKGIISVDETRLKNFVDSDDEEFREYMRRDSDIDKLREILGREPNEKDIKLYESAKYSRDIDIIRV